MIESATEAIERLDAVRAAEGDSPAILNQLATAYYKSGNLRMAVNALTTALKLDSDHVDSHLNVASLLLEARQLDLAQRHAERAIALAPQRYEAALGMGLLARARERSGEALEWLTRAEVIAPERVEAPMAIGATYQEMGLPADAIAAFDRALRWHASNVDLISNRLFATNFLPSFDAAEWLEAHRSYERRIRLPQRPTTRAAADDGRCHVGYVSGDLRNHAVARFLLPVLRHHDRKRFHITGYYTGRIVDAVTREIAGLCDTFRQVAAIGDDALITQIADDAIDVLIDLSGHSSGNRLPVFAARAAPKQITWLGYLGSTGVDAMDIRLSDAYADPIAISESWHSERLIRLPNTMWTYEPYPDAPDVVSAPCLRSNAITFGSLSNPSKLSDEALAAWAQILVALPMSRMLVMARDDAAVRERILAPFRVAEIDEARITLLSRMSTRAYLEAYANIDIALDAFPFSGGTTVCDALWQGVPVLAVRSLRPFGATAASALHQVGLDDWVVDSADGLVDRAIGMSRENLVGLRAQLRARMQSSPLLDAAFLTRTLEDILLREG